MEESPKKRIGAYAILLNKAGQILIVKTVYGHWILPGGMAENNESPKQACTREIKEELGLDIEAGEPIFAGYHNFDIEMKELRGEKELVWFAFGPNVLNADQIEKIKLQEEELIEYKFVDLEKLPLIVIDELKYIAQTISSGLVKRRFTYTESRP